MTNMGGIGSHEIGTKRVCIKKSEVTGKPEPLQITNREALSRLSDHNYGYAIIHTIPNTSRGFTDSYVWFVNWLNQPFSWNDIIWTEPMLDDIYGRKVTENDLV